MPEVIDVVKSPEKKPLPPIAPKKKKKFVKRYVPRPVKENKVSEEEQRLKKAFGEMSFSIKDIFNNGLKFL